MSLKKITFVLFLVLLDLFIGIKGINENGTVSSQNTSPDLAAYIRAYAIVVEETVANLKYLLQYWHEILLVEQIEIMRLRTNLGLVVRSISRTNQIRTLKVEDIIENNHVVLPALKALNDYLVHVKSNHQGINKRRASKTVQILSQEIELLSAAIARVQSSMARLMKDCNRIPVAILADIHQRQVRLDYVVKVADSLSQQRFPSREDLIVKRYAIMPLIQDLHRSLNSIETMFLQESVARKRGQELGNQLGQRVGLQIGQVGQRGQTGQVVQAGSVGLSEQGWQTIQAGPSGLSGQVGSLGLPGQVGPTGQLGQYGQGWQTGQAGGRVQVQGWSGWPAGQGIQGGSSGLNGQAKRRRTN